MTQRLNWLGKTNDAIDGLHQAEAFLSKNLDPTLLHLVKMRASAECMCRQ